MEGTRLAGRQPFMLGCGDGWREPMPTAARVEHGSGLGGFKSRLGEV